MAGEADKKSSLAIKGMDEPAGEIETSKAARAYHAKTQAELDAVTAAGGGQDKHSLWTVIILAAAVLATVYALMVQN